MRGKRFWSSVIRTPFKKMALQDANDPRRFIGKTVLAQPNLDADAEPIKVKEVVGVRAVTDPKLIRYYQINGTHLCHMLSFHLQVEEGRVPSKEELDEFDLATDVVKIKEIGGKDGKKAK